ncbi:hypothetical protein [Marmoricola sp. RAF53]|uniref:hypothetical protein n=1 Tax=Marmoricola sp. RAF53 TaxID=3233059 RepID=UPI003F997083
MIADLSVLTRIAIAYAIFAAAIAGAIAVITAIGNQGLGSGELAVASALCVALFVLRSCTMPWWYLKAGRTRYEVRDGALRISVGEKAVRIIPCDDINLVRIQGRVDWKSCLLSGFGASDFPRVTVRADQIYVGPPIMLWGAVVESASSGLAGAVRAQRRGPRRAIVESPGSLE